MQILWIVPKYTLPITDGARVATSRLIKFMEENGAKIHYLCLAQPNEVIDEAKLKETLNISNISVIRRPLPFTKFKKIIFYIKSFLSSPFTPITFSSFNDKGVKKIFNNFLINKEFDFCVLDGLHLGSLFIDNNLFIKPKSIKKIIYRAHNIEADLWLKYASDTRNLLKKLLLNFQAKLVRRWETLIINNVQGIAPISKEDLAEISLINSKKNMHLTPIGLDFSCPMDLVKGEVIKLYFIGKMDWAPNKEGLKWFLDTIWPIVSRKRDDLSLNIVGSGDRSWLEGYRNLKNINIIGFVDDIKDAYKDASLTIVPIHFGSGTRIKVIESYANNRCMMSTTLGAQGSDLTYSDYLMVNSSDEWIQALLDLKLDDSLDQMVESARLKMKNDFSDKLITEKFYSWLKTFK